MGLFDLFKKKGADDAPPPELQSLIRQLAAREPQARIEACRALGRLGPRARSASAALQELLNDDDGDVCNAAAAALSDIERHLA
jgi:HEAT repeat protein